jgi:hypothetical protein
MITGKQMNCYKCLLPPIQPISQCNPNIFELETALVIQLPHHKTHYKKLQPFMPPEKVKFHLLFAANKFLLISG